MPVFDPNQDYSKNEEHATLYDTVMEVQQLLQDITALLEMRDESPPVQLQVTFADKEEKHPTSHPDPVSEVQSEAQEQEGEDTDIPSIYDSIFA
jgi:aminopeptidase C